MVSATGLSLYATRVFDFVQEMGDLKIAVTQKISSLFIICDAKTWFDGKKGKTVSATGLSLCADRVFDFVQEMGDL